MVDWLVDGGWFPPPAKAEAIDRQGGPRGRAAGEGPLADQWLRLWPPALFGSVGRADGGTNTIYRYYVQIRSIETISNQQNITYLTNTPSDIFTFVPRINPDSTYSMNANTKNTNNAYRLFLDRSFKPPTPASQGKTNQMADLYTDSVPWT